MQELPDKLECLRGEEVLNNAVFWLKEGCIVLVRDSRLVQYSKDDWLSIDSGARAPLGVVMMRISPAGSWTVMIDRHAEQMYVGDLI